MKYIITIILIFLTNIQLYAQDLDSKILQLIEKNKIDKLRTTLTRIKNKYPYNPLPYYVEAFIEQDGEKAISLYKKFIQNHPNSSYVVNAKYKIAQYYFAQGEYSLSKDLLNIIMTKHSSSILADDAHYTYIRCLIALDQTVDIEKEIKKFVNQHPRSPYKKLLSSDFKKLKSTKVSTKKDKKRKVSYSTRNYTIQVGAFSDRQNALKQMNSISDWGYDVEMATKVVNHRLYYLIWVGNFETEEQALSFGEVFKRKYNLSFHVVKRK
jgi:tetratricopeptide (TPR) repeat protein